MIDNFALLVGHGLLLLAAWRLVLRPDLDDDRLPGPQARNGWGRTPEDRGGA